VTFIAPDRVDVTLAQGHDHAFLPETFAYDAGTPRRRHVSSRTLRRYELDLRTGVAQKVAASTAAGAGDDGDRKRLRERTPLAHDVSSTSAHSC
jgi:hypothetical protein